MVSYLFMESCEIVMIDMAASSSMNIIENEHVDYEH